MMAFKEKFGLENSGLPTPHSPLPTQVFQLKELFCSHFILFLKITYLCKLIVFLIARFFHIPEPDN
jgi:hypothetical protein